MWHNIDWNIFALDNILPTLRKPGLSALAQIVLKPLNSLYYKWYNWRVDNIYKLEHTGQICYLRGSLNDKFDPVERRIYIGNGLLYDTQYIFTEAEEQDVWLETDDEEETIWLRTESETADTGLDFIVYVPEAIYNNQLDGLKAHIDFYRAGGKRYNILIDE
ncbi:hypothetical protein GCM10008015_26930 [Flavobacterium palustre]|uniref:DUF4178 domain-containing protein n=1 Tax=Flavobacterium palustre TaxID=1476463 RepID=A0ABQ1HNX9_9FLAO|nr:hypothetical protein [Flavobacterium palustre]GGA84764.1 hypothetical protein GCM10008015_26930 [Flavobacterium palustre]